MTKKELARALQALVAMAGCDICVEGDEETVPVSQLRIRVYEDGDFRVEWWCHNEEYGGKQGESYATDAFVAAMTDTKRKMIGWFGIRYGKPLLFTESPEQAEEWEKAGIQVTGALVRAGVQTHAGRES